ncbi:hypothetical protein C8Q78DRAFT_1076056 [Trametes maxima]|nr:hypothetical protein C8Q78DRAFT_1076056 [Trametes maxima]
MATNSPTPLRFCCTHARSSQRSCQEDTCRPWPLSNTAGLSQPHAATAKSPFISASSFVLSRRPSSATDTTPNHTASAHATPTSSRIVSSAHIAPIFSPDRTTVPYDQDVIWNFEMVIKLNKQSDRIAEGVEYLYEAAQTLPWLIGTFVQYDVRKTRVRAGCEVRGKESRLDRANA